MWPYGLFFKTSSFNVCNSCPVLTSRHFVRHQNHRGPSARCLTGEAADSDLRIFWWATWFSLVLCVTMKAPYLWLKVYAARQRRWDPCWCINHVCSPLCVFAGARALAAQGLCDHVQLICCSAQLYRACVCTRQSSPKLFICTEICVLRQLVEAPRHVSVHPAGGERRPRGRRSRGSRVNATAW